LSIPILIVEFKKGGERGGEYKFIFFKNENTKGHFNNKNTPKKRFLKYKGGAKSRGDICPPTDFHFFEPKLLLGMDLCRFSWRDVLYNIL